MTQIRQIKQIKNIVYSAMHSGVLCSIWLRFVYNWLFLKYLSFLSGKYFIHKTG